MKNIPLNPFDSFFCVSHALCFIRLTFKIKSKVNFITLKKNLPKLQTRFDNK